MVKLKSTKCIFIGYSELTKGYKLFNLQTNEVIISGEVEFSEIEAWDWQNIRESQIGISLNEESLVESHRASFCTQQNMFLSDRFKNRV